MNDMEHGSKGCYLDYQIGSESENGCECHKEGCWNGD